MDRLDREQLYNTAWNHWGANTQLDMLIEEMAELTQAILRARRCGMTLTSFDLFEEMADVEICMEQLEVRLRQTPSQERYIRCYTHVEKLKTNKLLRLKERLMKSMTDKLTDVTIGNCGGNR